MPDPHDSPSSPPDSPVVDASAITRIVNIGRATDSAASSPAESRPARRSGLLSERLHRPGHAGRYLITGEIARGGMGVIYRGHDPDLDRDLAIKVLQPERLDQPDLVRLFLNEARICARLQHPGVVPIHELGTMQDGSPFIAMKLVEGRTFAGLLAERGQSAHELQRILRIFELVCQTMAYAHARGVIHCDLKPANVMVGAFGEVQVMDWGLGIDVNLTSTQGETILPSLAAVMGTPAYMAPEQARGAANVDARADVFALGAILCEILTGAPPFEKGDGETLQRASRGPTEPALERLRADGFDAALVDLACRCLEVEPADRPADAGILAMALTDHASGVQERLRQAELQWTAAVARAEAEQQSRRLMLRVVFVGVLGLVGLLGLAALWLR